MRRNRSARWTLAGVAALMLAAPGCSVKDNLDVARRGVAQFHEEMNQGKCEAIWNAASSDYRNASPLAQHRAFCEGVHRKVGDAGAWSLTGWNVNFTPTGNIVRMQCKTTFAHGEVAETFVWRVRGQTASLVGYNANSPLFVTSDD